MKKRVYQDKFHDVENDIRGNCFSACLATIMEIDLEEVPEFENTLNETWATQFLNFLGKKGWTFDGSISMDSVTLKDWITFTKEYEYMIVSGDSPRHEIATHSVVYRNGQPWHDPYFDSLLSDPPFLKGFPKFAYLIRKR